MGGYAEERQIEIARGLTPERFFHEYLIPRVPVLIPDATAHWPAHHKWTFSWLAATYGDADVAVRDQRGEQHEMKLGEYVAYTQEPAKYDVADGPLYLSDLGLHHLPEVLADYAAPAFIDDWFARLSDQARPPFRWFFVGPAGTGSQLHVDTSGTHAWLTQIHGEKAWRLFEPGALPLDYCGAADAFAPDLERFPALATARCITAVLRPGETLFVPCGWRHQVRNLTASWSLTENFCNASNALDVYQRTDELALRPALDELCAQQAHQLRAGEGDGDADTDGDGDARTAATTRALLRQYFAHREAELDAALAEIRRTKSLLG